MKLNAPELNAILAGLRLLQSRRALPVDVADIASNGGECDPLSDDGIDDLCQRINCAESIRLVGVAP